VRGGFEAAVFVARRQRREILVCRRSAALGGYWHTIAGGVEPGETAAQAALRELCEETGLEAELAAPTTQLVYPLAEEPPERRARYDPSLTDIQVDCFLVDAPDDWEPLLDHEHDEYRWCAPQDAVELLFWDDTSDALRRLLASEDA
jgi:8-oxo-dGTP pyrophosphatase MutT (NUDIX family)